MSYQGNLIEDAILYFNFLTRNVSRVPTTLLGTPTLAVYKNNDVGQSTAGITLTVDFDSVTGLNNVVIDTSADAFYAVGADYSVVITAGTVDGVSWVGEVVATFSIEKRGADIVAISGDATAADNLELQYDTTGLSGDTFPATQAQLGNIANTGAAVNTVAESVTVTTGTETNSYTDTATLDGTNHIVEDVAGTTDFYYQFDVGGDGVPVQVRWQGYAQSNGDSYNLYAYNWAGASWDQVGTFSASNGTTQVTETYDFTVAHVGTGANLGKVRFRIQSADGTAYATDRLLLSYSIVSRSVGYALGAIWVDTNGSNTNTENYVDGVADNPVSTWAAALTLNSQLGLNQFVLAPGSSILFSANSDNYKIMGYGAIVALGGQSVSGTLIEGAIVTGDDDGSNTVATSYMDCEFGNSTLGKHILRRCRLTGNITLAEAGDYLWDYCSSFVASNGTPDVTFPAGNAALSVRHYSGGMEINSMAAGDTMSYEGDGQFKIAADCTGGAVSIRGNIGPITDAASGAVTLTENARIADDTILDAVINDDTKIDASALNTMSSHAGTIVSGTAQTGTLSTTQMTTDLTEATNDHYIGRVIIWTSGVLQNQATDITDYAGSGGLLTFTAVTEAPSNGDTFIIV